MIDVHVEKQSETAEASRKDNPYWRASDLGDEQIRKLKTMFIAKQNQRGGREGFGRARRPKPTERKRPRFVNSRREQQTAVVTSPEELARRARSDNIQLQKLRREEVKKEMANEKEERQTMLRSMPDELVDTIFNKLAGGKLVTVMDAALKHYRENHIVATYEGVPIDWKSWAISRSELPRSAWMAPTPAPKPRTNSFESWANKRSKVATEAPKPKVTKLGRGKQRKTNPAPWDATSVLSKRTSSTVDKSRSETTSNASTKSKAKSATSSNWGDVEEEMDFSELPSVSGDLTPKSSKKSDGWGQESTKSNPKKVSRDAWEDECSDSDSENDTMSKKRKSIPTPPPSTTSPFDRWCDGLECRYFKVTSSDGLWYNSKPTTARDTLRKDIPWIPRCNVVVCSEIRTESFPGCPESVFARCLGTPDERWINVKVYGKEFAQEVPIQGQRLFRVVTQRGCQFRQAPNGARLPGRVAKHNYTYFAQGIRGDWVRVANGYWLPIRVQTPTGSVEILREVSRYEPTRTDFEVANPKPKTESVKPSPAAPASSKPSPRTDIASTNISGPAPAASKGDCSMLKADCATIAPASTGTSLSTAPASLKVGRETSWNNAPVNIPTPNVPEKSAELNRNK